MANINSNYSKKAKIWGIIKNIVFFIIAIVLIVLFIPAIKRVTGSLSIILPYLRFVVYIFFAIFVLASLSALNKRRKFLKKLKRVCSSNKAILSKINKPYLSVFFRTKNQSFTLKSNEKIYSCKLISFSNKFLPVIFKSDGFYYRTSARNLKKGLSPTFISEKNFGFESDFQKVLILTSIPYVVLVNTKNQMKPVDAGEVCGEYKIFNPSGFFGALERNCIDIKSFD